MDVLCLTTPGCPLENGHDGPCEPAETTNNDETKREGGAGDAPKVPGASWIRPPWGLPGV